MECPRTWIFVFFITNLSFKGNTLCQPGNIIRENRDSITSPGNLDLYNSVYTDLIPLLQGQQLPENLQIFPYNQDLITKPLSVVPMPAPGINGQESFIISSNPIRSSALNQNVIFTTPFPSGCTSNIPNPATPQTISSNTLPPSNCVSQIAQTLPLENYLVCAPNVGVVRPMPIVLQPQSQFNEVNPYTLYNQIAESISLPDVNNNLPGSTTCFGTLEITPNLNSLCLPQPTLLTSDGQQVPLNLQVNAPTSNLPAPRVTVVSNPSNSPVPLPAPCCPDYPAILPPYQGPPLPPIILGGSSKSSLQKWLPIILVALFSDRGCNHDGCCCCCPCNEGSPNNIPIPYPIPIPVNNPIINCPCISRNREEDDEDRKKK